jgi:tetratricopeptide (TPR) repeat protein
MTGTAETLALGWQYHQRGALDQAEQLYRQAAAAEPLDAQPWFMLGILHRSRSQFQEAITSYQEALRLKPDFVEALNNLGNVYTGLGRWADGIACYEKVLQQRPNYPEAHNNIGVGFRKQGQLDRAVASYREALRLRPDYPEAHNNLGDALQGLGRHAEAVASYEEALRLRPGYAEAHTNVGTALAKLERYDEAVTHHREALRLRPSYVEAHSNLGNAFLGQKDYEAAMASYVEALRLDPNYPEAHYNLGLALAEQGRLDEGIAKYRDALRLRPDYVEAVDNLGNALLAQGKTAEAMAQYDEILRRKPDAGEPHMSRALALLIGGDMTEGWREYEWRWKCKEFGSLSYQRPLWDGKPLEGRTILLHCEQGLGDTLQFVRYAGLVKQRGGRVILACPKPLTRLLATCPGVDRVIAQGGNEPLPDFDCYAPVLSLPGLCGTTRENIPAEIPYLSADPALVQHWRRELGPVRGFRVGIVWQGNPKYKADRLRSVPLAQFEVLARVPGVQLLSLQKGPGTEQLAKVADRFRVVDLGSRVDEQTGPFLDTAAVIRNLDLVIAPDTALLHLAGALGAPVWVALAYSPHWVWSRDHDHSPWYPKARLFRQTTWGDWDGVFARMADELRKLASAPRRLGPVLVEIAPGELLDKLTILEIKAERISDAEKLKHVREELRVLAGARDETLPASAELARLTAELKKVNEQLWDIEDEIRRCEAKKNFGKRFVELARSVYRSNDQRAVLKRQINDLLGSHLVEEKSYAPYEKV